MRTPAFLRTIPAAFLLSWIHAVAGAAPAAPASNAPAGTEKNAGPRRAPDTRPPYLGYAYPAGCRAGEVVEITLGGGHLYGATGALISGKGVIATIVDATDPEAGLDETQRKRRPKKPGGTQLHETITVRLIVAPEAPIGERELCIVTPNGASNRRIIQIGKLPELLENEPNNTAATASRLDALPVTLNGRLLEGDEDWFRFSVKRGQTIVAEMSARALIPYIADAVPGWFQGTLSLGDASGRELAYADDHRFNPDPVLCFTVPADGEYKLRVRDALSRGREDFVYRLRIGELPFITDVEPLGARRAANPGPVRLRGKNLPVDSVRPESHGDDPATISVERNGIPSNRVPFALSMLNETQETLLRTASPATPPRVAPPLVINGCIRKPGEKDSYVFRASAGDTVILQIDARKLGSPLDSKLTLIAPDGAVVAMNDDHKDPAEGLLTHHADSAITATLPRAGEYTVMVQDTQGGAGPEYQYRLRLEWPKPDFDLRVNPASAVIPAGGSARVFVSVVRKNGFTGPVRIVEDALTPSPAIAGGVIPEGRDNITITLTAPPASVGSSFALHLVGLAEIEGATRRRPALAVEDHMQAFIYHHAVPCRDLLVAVPEALPPFSVSPEHGAPTELARGRTTRIPLLVRRNTEADGTIGIRIAEPYKGVSIVSGGVIPAGRNDTELVVRTEAGTRAGNLQLNATLTLDPPEEEESDLAGKPASAPEKAQKIRITQTMPALRIPPPDGTPDVAPQPRTTTAAPAARTR